MFRVERSSPTPNEGHGAIGVMPSLHAFSVSPRLSLLGASLRNDVRKRRIVLPDQTEAEQLSAPGTSWLRFVRTFYTKEGA